MAVRYVPAEVMTMERYRQDSDPLLPPRFRRVDPEVEERRRVIVALLLTSLIIPIPWVWRWMMRWQLSQTELVERSAYASA